MVESSTSTSTLSHPAPNPNYLAPPTAAVEPSPSPPSQSRPRPLFSFPKRPTFRVTSEFDSDSSFFFHKFSCKFFDSLAKLKFSFQNNNKGEISDPQLSFLSKHLSVLYDLDDHDAFIRGSFDVGPRLQLRAVHQFKAQTGELALDANLIDPGYNLVLSSSVPVIGLPKATLKFPLGEVSLEEKEEEEVKRLLSVRGILKGQILNGVCTAQYEDDDLKLRYCYKDDELSFIPRIILPSNSLSFALKRRFGPSDKLSYWYNFDSNFWSAVYKHSYGKDFKLKAGYDSEVRLSWASLWVGDDGGKAKTSPMKMRVQCMLQVPQDDIKSSVLMFRVKKRWDI